jgi:hypothetical protein
MSPPKNTIPPPDTDLYRKIEIIVALRIGLVLGPLAPKLKTQSMVTEINNSGKFYRLDLTAAALDNNRRSFAAL